jgi:hypothetical protein
MLLLYKKTTTKIQKTFEKKLLFFSHIFPPILHNIELYIYTVKYKSGIKIPGFLRNISKKISKTFKSISFFKKNCFYTVKSLNFSKHIFH